MNKETDFAPHCLCLDLEVDPVDKRILKIGALRPDTGRFLHFKGKYSLAAALGEVDGLAVGATFVLGHNVIRHDLNLLKALAPGLKLLELPERQSGSEKHFGTRQDEKKMTLTRNIASLS